MSGAPGGDPEDILEGLPLGEVDAFIEEQYNVIEQVKAWFDVDDDSLAVIAALLLQSQATDRAILRALRGQPIDIPEQGDIIIDGITVELPEDQLNVDVGTVDLDTSGLEDAVRRGVEAADLGGGKSCGRVSPAIAAASASEAIAFPRDGRAFSLPAGTGGNRHNMKLEDGSVAVNGVGSRQLQGSLPEFDADIARSGQLWADDAIVVYTYDANDNITGVWELDAGWVTFGSSVIHRVELDAERPFNLRALFSVSDNPPATAAPTYNAQRRYGHLRTTDGTALQTIPFVGPNPTDYGESTLNDAADTHGDADIYGAAVGQHVWIIKNTESTDAEVQARIINVSGEQAVADNDIHNSVDTANTNVATVPANDFVQLESGITGTFFQLLAQSATDTNAVELEIQYAGFNPVLRS